MAQARTIAETELDILRIRAMRVKMIGSAAKSASDPSLTEEPVPEAHAVAAFPASPMQSEDAQHALLGHCPNSKRWSVTSAGSCRVDGELSGKCTSQACDQSQTVRVLHIDYNYHNGSARYEEALWRLARTLFTLQALKRR